MSEILRAEDAVDVMTSVLLTAAKIRIQAGKFGFERILIGTTTNIANIRKYTEHASHTIIKRLALSITPQPRIKS